MFVPLAHVRFFGDAALVLNSRSIADKLVTPIWYVDGQGTVVGNPILFEPGVKYVQLRDLLPDRVKLANLNGLELSYSGKSREIWAQATLMPRQGSQLLQSLEAVFTMSEDFKSNRREAVWTSRPGKDRAVVVLVNVSNQPLTITVAHPNAEQTVTLAPKAARALILMSRSEPSGADWIRLTFDGAADALRSTGFSFSPRDQRSHLLRFYDPAAAAQEKLFATNLHVRNVRADLALKNTTAGPVAATVEFLDPDSGMTLASLPNIHLASDGGTSVSLDYVLASLQGVDEVGVRVNSTGGAGSVIGDLEGFDVGTERAFELPLRDSGGLRNSTGAYPWRLDGDYNTRVTITNVGTTPAIFSSRIQYSGGEYVFTPRELPVGATAVFDLRDLRNSQTPDAFGRRLPPDAKLGQFYWTLRDARPGAHFAGRAEISSGARNVNSSYSCNLCCTDSYVGGGISPDPANVGLGATDFVVPIEHMRGCYSGEYDQPAYVTSWSGYDGGVSYVHTEGYGSVGVDGLGDGSTVATGYWTSVEAQDEEIIGGGCITAEVPAQVQLHIYIRTPTSLSVVSDNYISPGSYNYNRERILQVLDQYGVPMQIAGMAVTESYSPNPPSGNCTSSTITTGSGATNSDGKFQDNYYLAGGPNPCSSSSTQTVRVNGRTVATFSVTWHYSTVDIQ
jgi:hypothetical protein